MPEKSKFETALEAALGLDTPGTIVAVSDATMSNTRRVLDSLTDAFSTPVIEADGNEVTLEWGGTVVSVSGQASVVIENANGAEECLDITSPESLQKLRIKIGDAILNQAL